MNWTPPKDESFTIGHMQYASLYFCFKQMEKNDHLENHIPTRNLWKAVLVYSSLNKEWLPELHFVLGNSNYLKNLGKKI